MAKPQHPLIRVPTVSNTLSVFGVLVLAGLFGGMLLGSAVGHGRFGVAGAIGGGLVGGVLGIILGRLPGFLVEESMFRSMRRCSNAGLQDILTEKNWNFRQTLALLNLQLRGEDVHSYLPRVLALLESNDRRTRLFGRDALRLVFTPLGVQLDACGYDPLAPTEDCQNKVAKLRQAVD